MRLSQRTNMKGRLGFLLGVLFVAVSGRAAAAGPEPTTVLKSIGARRGLCVVLGDRDCAFARAMAGRSEVLVFVQLSDPAQVAAARKTAYDAGLYGTRIYVDGGPMRRIHLADNLADAVVALGAAARKATGAARREILRVLRPGGTAFLGRERLLKPVPKGLDDWSHYHHDPANSLRSRDRVARAPYWTHFLAEPWYGAMPEVTVAAAGRVFKAFGHLGKGIRAVEPNTLVAMNGYNGAILWERKLVHGYDIHRNCMIATPDTLYLADSASCKLIDPATGKVRDEITVPAGASGGPAWKWIALEDGTLYALTGAEKPYASGWQVGGLGHGWWLNPKQYNKELSWLFGTAIIAVDPATKKLLWSHRESRPIDSRAMCMKNGRIFFHSPDRFVGCLDAKTGKEIWKLTRPGEAEKGKPRPSARRDNLDDGELERIFNLLGRKPDPKYDPRYIGFVYAACTDEAVYFGRDNLLALSAGDGFPLWFKKGRAVHMVIGDDGLYAMRPGEKIDLLTGKKIASFQKMGGCVRATSSIDSIFVRGNGTVRIDLASNRWERLFPIRSDCHDGVIVAGGLLYFGPWLCDCKLSLVGVIALAPRGDFDIYQKAVESERLEVAAGNPAQVRPFAVTPDDWPTYRADNVRNAAAPVAVPESARLLWTYTPPAASVPTAPVAAGGVVFTSGADGVVRALDAAGGKPRWIAHTGGPVQFPPSVWNGRVFVGSGDGWVYCFEAATGRLLWRFRAAPLERKIPVYGTLSSTWPAASGVLVERGVAYAAAGIASYDGTHVYALDAVTGKIRWQNSTGSRRGQWKNDGNAVGVQGHLTLYEGRLYLAGGNVVNPAVYDIKDGTYLEKALNVGWWDNLNMRSRDLYVIRDPELLAIYQKGHIRGGNEVRPSGHILYAPELDYYSTGGGLYVLQASDDERVLVRRFGTFNQKLKPLIRCLRPEAQGKPRVLWERRPVYGTAVGMALTGNAALLLGINRARGKTSASAGLTALRLADGTPLWQQALPAIPALWGLAVDRKGRTIVTLRDGRVLCFGRRSG